MEIYWISFAIHHARKLFYIEYEIKLRCLMVSGDKFGREPWLLICNILRAVQITDETEVIFIH